MNLVGRQDELTISLILDSRALAYYDEDRAAWIAGAGKFEVLVGSSSRDIRAQASLILREELIIATP
jgi:beta-glucosidase